MPQAAFTAADSSLAGINFNTSDQAQHVQHNESTLPEYDTLSIAPPAIDEPSSSSVSPPNRDDAINTPQSRRQSIKQKWKQMKQDDERRRAERYTYITPEGADRITGLDKHRELEAKKSAERKRGGKSALGILLLS